MISRDQVFSIVQRKGPLIPATIAQELKIDLLFAQAYLSELSSEKMVKVSHLKVGGSPLYYVPGQESKLQNFAERLSEKDRRTYDLLKQEKVLADRGQEPLTRVSLREIRDFAVMLEVRVGDETQIFWKWYECSNDAIASKVKGMLGQVKKKAVLPEPEQHVAEPVQQREEPTHVQPQPAHVSPRNESLQKSEPLVQTQRNEPRVSPLESARAHLQQSENLLLKRSEEQQLPKSAQLRQAVHAEERIDLRKKQPNAPQQNEKPHQSERQLPSAKQANVKQPSAPRQKSEPKSAQQKLDAPEVLIETHDPLSDLKDAIAKGDTFLETVVDFFERNDIGIGTYSILRKNSDAEFVVSIPSAVGPLDFVCRAKNKKRCNDGDLSSAYLQAQLKKLPILFLTTGEITKKAEEMLSKEFSGMKVHKLVV